jgi:phospholipase/carboxylesterase
MIHSSPDPHRNQPLVHVGEPVSSARGAVIMIHGRNAAPANILSLVPLLDRPEFAYLAPAAADGTWYPYSFLAERDRNEPGLSSALAMLERVVNDTVSGGVPKERIMLLGFSQGACLTAEFAAGHADRYGGVILFTGGLIGPPGTTWPYAGTFKGTPVFLGSSDVDAHVPRARVGESREVFERMGASVTERIYPGMGHLVNDDEIEFARGVMDSILGLVA